MNHNYTTVIYNITIKKHKVKIMKKITQVDRVLRILEILSEGKEVCLDKDRLIEQMKDSPKFNDKDNDLKVGLRALQKDMAYVREYLGENLTKKGACYRLVQKKYLENFFKDNHKEIKKFFHAIALIDKSVFGEKFKKYSHLLDSIQEQQKGVYLFLENPFENLKQLELKEKLEGYIQQRRYIRITYHSDREYQFDRVQPYKIIYQNGNWYLAVLTTQDYEVNDGFRLLRLNFITKVEPCKEAPTNFYEDAHVKYFLEHKFQSLFTSFNKKFFTVKIRVAKEVARHFRVKQYLKSQRIVGEIDGDLIVEFTINDDMEIIPMVQMWMPHIKIVEPQRLHERVLGNIAKY